MIVGKYREGIGKSLGSGSELGGVALRTRGRRSEKEESLNEDMVNVHNERS